MFKNRQEAGSLLAKKIQENLDLSKKTEFTILGIPRGGVVVAKWAAQILQLDLDIIITKKISAPVNPELAIGAVGQTMGSHYLNERILSELKIPKNYVEKEIKIKQSEISRREEFFRAGKPEIPLKNRRVILIDDGVATGATMIAAAREIWNREPKQLIIAVPVCAKNTFRLLEQEADMVLALETPEDFYAVGQFYEEFEQAEDEEVINLIKRDVIASLDA